MFTHRCLFSAGVEFVLIKVLRYIYFVHTIQDQAVLVKVGMVSVCILYRALLGYVDRFMFHGTHVVFGVSDYFNT